MQQPKTLILAISTCAICGILQATHCLQNQHVRFDFSSENFFLTGITNRKTGRTVHIKDQQPFWSMSLIDENQRPVKQPRLSPPHVTRERHGNRQVLKLSWPLTFERQRKGVAQVTISLPDDDCLADWHMTMELSGKPPLWIKELTFPRLAAIGSLGHDSLYYGHQLGRRVRQPGTRLMGSSKLHFPGSWAMQFAAFVGNQSSQPPDPGDLKLVSGYHAGPREDETGLFLGVDDGRNHYKDLKLGQGERPGCFELSVLNYPAFPHWPRRGTHEPTERFSYDLPYSFRLGAFAGGIGKAAKLYRNIVKVRPWMKNGTLDNPANPTSRDVLNCAFWCHLYHGANKILPEMLPLRDYFKVPLISRPTIFTVNRFDDNNLNYCPMLSHVREGFNTLREAGIAVAPYVCCGIWDPDTETYRRYGMDKAVARDEYGMPSVWMLRGQPSYRMNPASPTWRKQYQKVTERLFGQWNTNGQYMDVMALAGQLCYNTDLHLPHGGTYWSDGNQTLLNNLRKAIARLQKNNFLTSEGFSENYIGRVDAFLLLDLSRYSLNVAREVYPLFPLVYHDYAVTYGSDCRQAFLPDRLRWELGHCFIWGIQASWSHGVHHPPKDRIHDRFTRQLVQAWHQAGWKFLACGRGIEMAQAQQEHELGNAPIGLLSQPHQVHVPWPIHYTWRGPSVLASAWEASDHSVGITMANISGHEQQPKLYLKKTWFTPGQQVIWKTWPLPVTRVGRVSQHETLNLTLPPDTGMILELRDETKPVTRPLVQWDDITVTADQNGDFPRLKTRGNKLFGTGKVTTVHENGYAFLAAQDGKPLKAKTFNWMLADGISGPRDNDYRTFYLLKDAGCELSGYQRAAIRVRHGVMTGRATVTARERMTGDDTMVLLAQEENGPLRMGYKGLLELEPGSYRIAAFKPDKPWLCPQKKTLMQSLATISRKACQQAMDMLSGEDNLPAHQRTEGERLLAVGQAATWVATGQRARLVNDQDWLIPGKTTELSYQTPTPGNLTLLNSNHRPSTLIDAGRQKQFNVTVTKAEDSFNLFRILFRSHIRHENQTFELAALNYLEVAEPLLVEIPHSDETLLKNPDADEISVRLDITNVSSVSLPLSITYEGPDSWRLPDGENPMRLVLAASSHRQLKVRLLQTDKPGGMKVPLNLRVSYSKLPETDVFETFTVVNRDFLTICPMTPRGDDARQLSKPFRHQALLALARGNATTVTLEVHPVFPGVRKDSQREVKVTLMGNDLRVLKTQRLVLLEGKPQKLNLTLPEDQLAFIRVAGKFFSLGVEGVPWHGYCSWEHEPFILSGAYRQKVFFQVLPNARTITFSGEDGGPGEPADIWVRDSRERVIFHRKGAFHRNETIVLTVPPEEDGSVWSMELEPVDDLKIRMGTGTNCWFSHSPDCVFRRR